jgi:hypothetical protein
MVSLCLSAAGLRFSILPSPAGDLGLPHGRLTAGVCPADPIGVYTFRMRKMCDRGGCLLYAEIFGVHAGADHKLRTECDRSSSSQPGNFDDLFLFRRVDEDSLSFTRPVFA